MSIGLRVLLIVGAIVTLIFMLAKIRQAKVKIEHSLFWITFALFLVALGTFPQIAFKAAELIGIVSPTNFVFLAIICVLIVKLFFMTIEISNLEHRIELLTQNVALRNKNDN